MLLYIHVPFCRAKCRYCAFYSVPLPGLGALREYTNALLLEIAHWGDTLGREKIESIFFGGGTPSLLPPKLLQTILGKIRAAFDVSPKAEITLEANPDSLLAIGYAHDIAALGVNRLSLGVQSLDEGALAALGRPHGRREALMAYELARSANFASVSLDLIWGLPGQRRRDWMRELAEVAALQPDHLSCYGLTLEDGTPMAKAFEEGLVELPVEKDQAAMYVDGADYLETAGLLQYEISNFARMGFQCRHNLGYWENSDYLGLGPGATSTMKGVRWTNPQDIGEWAGNVRAGIAARDAETLSPKIRLLETVMLRLRTTRGLRIKAYRDMTGRDFMKDNKELLHLLHRQGLVRFRNGYVRLTRNGMLVSNSILEYLFDAMESRLEGSSGNEPHMLGNGMP
ncbi:Oxygen-independent coproporphyrinogen III oxidase [uncultured delta proteobacterium]|uniref:Heme chaperone HemW n=1 Tax=uncultured delta proteobacterium TaxID=34034 RepID=A0A212JUS3_9DELT|nr:Oxygen-independent coproporphyrinogen III oxidase [uncultured delta proteobacterium]